MAEPLELEDLYDHTQVMEVAVSPDGDRVAYVALEFDPGEDRRRNSLFVVPADGSRDPHRLTRASDAGQAAWSPDGSRLAFVAAREEDLERKVGREEDEADDADGAADEGSGGDQEESDDHEESDEEGPPPGDDEPKPQVWAFDVELGGDARQVTDREEGVSEFDWGPDGDRIVFASRDPTDDQREYLEEKREGGPIEIERLQHKANGAGWLDEVTTYLFVTDLETGDTRRLDDAYAQGARAPIFGTQVSWAPGERIAFGSTRTENPDDSGVYDLYTIAPDGGDLRRVTDGEMRTYAYEWAPDGDRIAFVGGDPENWYEPAELYVTDRSRDTYRSVSASLDRTVTMMSTPSWLDDGTVLAGIGDEGWTRLVRLHADGDSPERVFDRLGRDRTIGFAGFDYAGGTLAVAISDPERGEDLYTLDPADLGAEEVPTTELTGLNDDLIGSAETPRTRRVTYENEDGVEVEAITYLPAGFDPETDDPRPVIASIHGGPMAYDAPEFDFNYAYWTGQGYVVYCPNYRGSTSYGREFAESLKGTRGDLETDDVVSGLDHLADRGWVDPGRAFVTGFSYGGITTANVVTSGDDPFVAAAAEHGIYDMRSTFGTDDNHLWHEWEFGLPWEEPELFDEISSITDVDRVDTPLLVTAGENDWRCPPTQAEQLYVSVRKQGVPAKLVIYQDEHHDVGDPDRAIHRLETLTDWFETHDPAVESGNGGGDDE